MHWLSPFYYIELKFGHLKKKRIKTTDSSQNESFQRNGHVHPFGPKKEGRNFGRVEVEPVDVNPLNPELNPICYLLALLGAHHFLHVSRIRVKLLTFKQLMSYIYGAPILDVSRSHTTTQHSR